MSRPLPRLFGRLAAASGWMPGPLYRKYVLTLVAAVTGALIVNGSFEIWFSFRDHKASLVRIQREQAQSAAAKIGQFIKDIEAQVGWTVQIPWSLGRLDQRRYDGVRLLRQVPAITELSQLDAQGREQVRVSRLAVDVIGSEADFSADPKFTEAVANKVYYGPVYFRRESEPYMTLSLAGARRESGVSIVEVNLKLIWDVVSQIKVGESGQAYVIDAGGRLIAHPDISLVLRNIDLTHLAQVRAARTLAWEASNDTVHQAEDILGRKVLTAHAAIYPLGWLVFVELPVDEAYAPLISSIGRAGALLLAGLALALVSGLFLARKMVIPIQALRQGAERIGRGELDQRLSIDTGDELEGLGNQFNRMAAQLKESYDDLERKVAERTRQLELANSAKSRFIAAASHDLRQPLHALGLFVGQLRSAGGDRSKIVERIETALAEINKLFDALLDMSKLDAGIVSPTITEFPIAQVLEIIESDFAQAAQQKGLSLRIVPCAVWVRSDIILIERILLNLVSNAVRYTACGGVVVGCRRRGDSLRIEVWDTGPGIPEDQRRKIFDEFVQLVGPDRPRQGGLGLGLAIVDRLRRILDHPLELTSMVGRGSRFALVLPIVAAPSASPEATGVVRAAVAADSALVVVIDDDPLVLEGMGGLLRSWGYRVAAASSRETASRLGDARPDLIVCDYHLASGETGIAAIERLRQTATADVPAFLISGDTAPERLREARERGFHLLHKPVGPMMLRAMVSQLLARGGAEAAGGAARL